jgi:formylglycine-generating enzyme required for sulfatase activity
MATNRKLQNILMTLLSSGFLMACSDSGPAPTPSDEAAPPAINPADSPATHPASSSTASKSTLEPSVMNLVGIEFVLIPAGEFMMGCGADDWACEEDEKPQHHVKISQPFYLGKYEVTQSEWASVMAETPSRFKGESHPVENVSWNDVQVFISRLNEKEGTHKYRLPTEAEWEYAARAGTTSAYYFGNDVANLGRYAWYDGNSGGRTHPVGQKQANPWGLHDMHGNVWEWVADEYKGSYSNRGHPHNPRARALRGGSWSLNPWSQRSAFRMGSAPNLRSEANGFRLAFSPE